MPIITDHGNGVRTIQGPTQEEIDSFYEAHPYGTFIMRKGPSGTYPIAVLYTHCPTTGVAITYPTYACVCPEYQTVAKSLLMQAKHFDFRLLDPASTPTTDQAGANSIGPISFHTLHCK